MINVEAPVSFAPKTFKTELQKLAYESLAALKIPFTRVDTDEAITMQDCEHINEKLGVKTVKSLFLRNRQKTCFYLFITTAQKAFCTKAFGAALGIARVSFAPAELLYEILGVHVGATTIFGLLRDTQNKVQLVVDNDILREEYFGCSDSTTTCYMKFETKMLVEDLIPYTKHEAKFIDI